MQYPLMERLAFLEQFKDWGKEFGISLAEEELKNAEVRVLEECYGEDKLASDVSEGIKSYTQLIEPIEKKYGSLWRRIWYPGPDKTFDDEVVRVLGSMNNVEDYYYTNPRLFTTSERRQEIGAIDKGALLVGALLAAMFGFIAYGMPYFMQESLKDVNVYVQALMKSSPVISLAAAYAAGKVSPNSNMKRYLNHLKESAQEIDEFLREHRL